MLPADGAARVLTHRGTTTLTGPTIYEWLRRLTPYLDGSATLDELTSGLSTEKRDMVTRVVDAFETAGLLRSGAEPVGDPLALHLDSVRDDAVVAAARYRDAKVAVTGVGPMADGVAAALRSSGIGTVRTGHSPGDGADLVVAVLHHVDEQARPADVYAVQRGDELWIRAGDWEPAREAITRWPEEGPGTAISGTGISGTAAAVAANMIGTAAFRLLTGTAGPRDTGDVVRLHLPTLHGSSHRLPTGAAPDEPFDVSAARLVDPRTGVLGEVSERDYAQLPLNVAAATVAGRSRPAIGAGPTPALARTRAAVRGLLSHLTPEPEPGCGPPAMGAGATREEAVSAALSELCAGLTAAEPDRCVPLDPAGLVGDDEAAAYRVMADILGLRVQVHDVTGPLGLPTLAYGVGDRTIAYVSAPTAGATLSAGLRAVLLDEQSRRHGQLDYAPAPVPQLDHPATGAPGPAPAPSTTSRVAEVLAAQGRAPEVVELDHDPVVRSVLGHVVGVTVGA